MLKGKSIRKSEFAELYGLSDQQLQRLLNKTYYTELLEVRYDKDSKTLQPNVIRKFIEIHGVPFNESELLNNFLDEN